MEPATPRTWWQLEAFFKGGNDSEGYSRPHRSVWSIGPTRLVLQERITRILHYTRFELL